MSKSGSGANYYHEEIKELLQLLQRLPETIPVGVDHDFRGYAPDGGRWVDDLRQAARTAIQAAGNSLPREIQTTAAKRLFEHDAIVDKTAKKAKVDQKAEKERRKAAVDIAKKKDRAMRV
ncbi:hypothetical protein C8F04DRAFT_1230889 [Mycena alexandri]|uniref:Uncharacterized protein n=1 Tax=Mycena alexandri TaxID=1745969 RepID=A0AAD6T680_9AGAR|nr:hypothetical protein C8F04DRAFT_1230889 [Mycena alexandri]